VAHHVVRLGGISKRFPGVTAVDGVDLDVFLVTKQNLKHARVKQMVTPACD